MITVRWKDEVAHIEDGAWVSNGTLHELLNLTAPYVQDPSIPSAEEDAAQRAKAIAPWLTVEGEPDDIEYVPGRVY